MTWPDQVHERADPGGEPGWRRIPARCARPARPAGRGRRGGLYSCSSRTGLPGAAGAVGWQAAAGLDRTAWRRRTGSGRRAEPLALVKPLVQVQDDRRLGREVRVAGVDPRLVLPGLDRVLGQDPQHRGRRELGLASPGPGELGRQFRAGPARQRHPGRGGQLAGQRDHRGPGQLADPPRPPGAGQVSQPVQAAAGEPAPPLAHRIHADPQVRGDPGIVAAARGSQHDLRPQPVPPAPSSPPGRVCSRWCARRRSA